MSVVDEQKGGGGIWRPTSGSPAEKGRLKGLQKGKMSMTETGLLEKGGDARRGSTQRYRTRGR